MAPVDEIISGAINSDRTFTRDKRYLLRGFVNVMAPATLTIEPGTVIFGEDETMGTLIINRGARISAVGTPDRPIVFTSPYAPGHREPGDWGGIILAGNASVNTAGGTFSMEGTGTQAGGGANPDDDDSSGEMRYVRIEFGGKEITPNNEINGLTMGAVGRGTKLEYIQVSYVDDDGFEWFGGTVDGRHLISLGNIDDDMDGDLGWRGRVQHALIVRDPDFADAASGGHSNSFEQDNAPNESTGSTALPRSAPVFSNVTVIGPRQQAAEHHPHYQNAMRLRTGTQIGIFNSVMIGFPGLLRLDGPTSWNLAQAGALNVQYVLGSGDFVGGSGGVTVADVENWFLATGFGNQHLDHPDAAQLANPYLHALPDRNDFDPRPLAGSPVLGAASFTQPRLSDSFFESTTYAGAFAPDGTRWDLPWADYDPQGTDHVALSSGAEEEIPNGYSLEQNYPNPFNPSTAITFELSAPQHVKLTVLDVLGREVAVLVDAQRSAGRHSEPYTASGLPSGVYLYRLELVSGVKTKTMLLLK